MPLIQESNNKMTPVLIAPMKTQSLTRKNDNSKWTLAKTALASGIISSLGLAYLTYKHYGQKDIITPLVPHTNPIGTALKVLLPVSIVASSLYYCFKNNSCQRNSTNTRNEDSEEDSTRDAPPYSQEEDSNDPHRYTNFSSSEDFDLIPGTPSSQNETRSLEFPQDFQNKHFDPDYLEFPVNLSFKPQPPSPYSSLRDIKTYYNEYKKFFYKTWDNFNEKKEITDDTKEAINFALKNNDLFEEDERENMLQQLVIFASALMTVEKNHDLAADLIWNIYKMFSSINDERAVDIATYCLFIEKPIDESENNNFIIKCEKIVKRTKSYEHLFLSFAVKCSKHADTSPPHDNVVKEFLEKYKEIGEVIVNYMIGCSKLSNSYAQEKIKSLHFNQGTSIPLLISCIDNLFGNSFRKVDTPEYECLGNKAVVLDFFERRYDLINCKTDVLLPIQNVIESYKAKYGMNDQFFINVIINAVETEGDDYKCFADNNRVLLQMIFEFYKLSNNLEKMEMLYNSCKGHQLLLGLTSCIEDTLKTFEANINQSTQKPLTLDSVDL